ncbi:MAG: hypothetical protein ACON5J_18925 [Rubripirellula sp.]
MEYKIFYSWQSDLPHRSNRSFIREAIDEAVSSISKDGVVEDSPRVDEGMDGVAGTPEVATIMFQKIDSSAIFIGDVSLVGSTEPFDENRVKKRTPNPNVLLEMGYAAARIGWNRIICVMNERFGERQEQPFDVRNRRFPINYRLEPGKDPNRDTVKTRLAGDIKGAIEVMALSEHQRVATIRTKLDSRCLNLMNQFASQPSFPSPNTSTAGQVLASIPIDAAIMRLLDLGVIRADVNTQIGLYAYHWTYLGDLVLRGLAMRK